MTATDRLALAWRALCRSVLIVALEQHPGSTLAPGPSTAGVIRGVIQ